MVELLELQVRKRPKALVDFNERFLIILLFHIIFSELFHLFLEHF